MTAAVLRDAGRRIVAGARQVVLRFILPVAGLGVVLLLVETGLEAFGVHGDVVKGLRMAVIPLYLVIAVAAARKNKG